MKKFVIISIIILLAGFSFLVWFFLNGEYIGEKTSAAIYKATGSAPHFQEKPEITLFPPTLNLKNVSWQSGGDDHEIRLAVKKASVKVAFLSLFSGQMAIREINLDNPVLEISNYGNSSPDLQKSRQIADKERGERHLEIDRILIHNGKFVYRDDATKYAFTEINVSADNLGPKKEADIKCDFLLDASRISGKEKNSRLFSGNLAISAKMRYYLPNLTFRLASVTFTPTQGVLPLWLSPLGLEFEGAINSDSRDLRINNASLSFPSGQMAMKGEGNLNNKTFNGHATLELDTGKLCGFTFSTTKNRELVADGTLNFNKDKAGLQNLVVKTGDSQGSGYLEFKLPNENKSLLVSGHLALGQLDLLETQYHAGQGRKDTGTQTNISVPMGSHPEINMKISAQRIKYGKFQAENIHFGLNGENGNYAIRQMEMDWAGGHIEIGMNFAMPNKQLVFSAQGKNIDPANAFGQFGMSGLSGGKGKFKADLTACGSDRDSIKKSLGGNISCEASNVQIEALTEMSRLLPTLGKNHIPEGVEHFSANATAKNGILDIRPIILKSRGLDASGNAVFNLPVNYLDGSIRLKTLGLDLPLVFRGNPEKLSWTINRDYLFDLMKEIQ